MGQYAKSIFHKAWAAGIFDGEGTIGIYKRGGLNKYKEPALRRKVSIGMVYKPSLDLLHEHYGGFVIKHNASSKNYPDFRIWKWELSHRDNIKKFLLDIQPYLTEKREQADILLAQIDGFLTMEEGYYMLLEAKQKNKIDYV